MAASSAADEILKRQYVALQRRYQRLFLDLKQGQRNGAPRWMRIQPGALNQRLAVSVGVAQRLDNVELEQTALLHEQPPGDQYAAHIARTR